jgi:hypothetical protein
VKTNVKTSEVRIMETTSHCWLCGEDIEHNIGDGAPARREYMALERHLDKEHRNEPFSVSGVSFR